MTCQENIECFKQVLPLVLAVLALIAVVVIVSFKLDEYVKYVNELLGFALVNLGVSR